MVADGQNANKYYDMVPQGDRFEVKFGRVGSSCQTSTYPISQWNSKYNEKIHKGYIDRTSLVAETIAVTKSEYAPIKNASISAFVDRLRTLARQAIDDNYTISSSKVTNAMVQEAQNVLSSLVLIEDITAFNKLLIELFGVIPRKMGNVKSLMAKDRVEFGRIIEREQDLLDVMKGQVVQPVAIVQTEEDSPDQTILEACGLQITEANELDEKVVRAALGGSSEKFKRAWCLRNNGTQINFDKFQEENGNVQTELLWHGSRNENWWSIIRTGLVLKPTNAVITGKMFGYGIYFAPSARKSIGYTSLEGSYWARGGSPFGFMGLYDVAYGTPHDVHSF
jgi:poly [ADP-ribose] polymerase